MPSQLVRLYRQIDTCFRSALGRGRNLLIEERIVILHTKERIPPNQDKVRSSSLVAAALTSLVAIAPTLTLRALLVHAMLG